MFSHLKCGVCAASGPAMDVRCDRCHTEYELDDESVTEGGASVQCTSCGHTFLVTRSRPGLTPTPSPVVDSGAPSWMLTTVEGKTHRFRDPTTLQKWIVERRVTREDRVCPPGESWRRLADMDDLRPFFEVVDQADRAAAGADRGSSRDRATMAETPTRRTPANIHHAPAAGYASPDEDDDDVLTSGARYAGELGPAAFRTGSTPPAWTSTTGWTSMRRRGEPHPKWWPASSWWAWPWQAAPTWDGDRAGGL